MKRLITTALLVATVFFGCKKNSTPAPPASPLGAGGLTKDQTVNILTGHYWQTADSVTTDYYDINNKLLATSTTFDETPYWAFNLITLDGAQVCNLRTSDSPAINPSGAGELGTIGLTVFNGATTIDYGVDKYVVESISTNSMTLIHTESLIPFLYYKLNGQTYTAYSANQRMVFTKYN